MSMRHRRWSVASASRMVISITIKASVFPYLAGTDIHRGTPTQLDRMVIDFTTAWC